MVQIPQGKALRVLSILERVGADGEDEVCYALASRAVVVAWSVQRRMSGLHLIQQSKDVD